MRHLQIYAYIRAVVEQGSIRKASEMLTISPSALNRQILALEADLGVDLFERLPVGVRLSSAGEIYYRHIIEHIAALEGAAESVSALRGFRYGHVRVAVSPELAGVFLAREMARTRADHPGLRFEVMNVAHDEFAAALLGRKADLALIVQPVHQVGVETLASCTAPLAAITAGPGRGDLRSEDLIEHDVILPPRGSGLRERIDLEFRQRMLPLDPVIESAQLLAPVAQPRRSLQFWPHLSIDEAWLSAHRAVALGLQRPVGLRIVLARAEGRVLPVAAERFATQLAEQLERRDHHVSV